MSGNAPPAPTLTYLPHPEDLQVWSVLRGGASNVENGAPVSGIQFKDVQIKDPLILIAPDNSNRKRGLPQKPTPESQTLLPLPPPNGFLVGGNIDVFGISNIQGKLTTFHGPRPSHIPASKTKAIFQHVEITTVSIGSLIPSLTHTPFDGFAMNDIRITYQSQMFDNSKAIGWHIEADMTIDENFGVLHDFLNKTLGLTGSSLTLGMYAYLGTDLNWNKPPSLSSFSICGFVKQEALPGKKFSGFKLTDSVTLTEIGVRLTGMKTYSIGLGLLAQMEYGFEVFGELAITIPGAQTPLILDYSIGEMLGNITMSADLKGDIWRNAFGLGINLDGVVLAAEFSGKEPLKSLDISFGAVMNAGNLQAIFKGKFAASGDVDISAKIDNITFDDISDFFNHLSGDQLELPEKTDIILGSASINITKTAGPSNIGWNFSVKHFEYDKYSCSSATVSRKLNSIEISGELDDIAFADVKVESAQMHATLEGTNSNRSSDVFLTGSVILPIDQSQIRVSATVHLSKSSSEQLEWAVCCELDALDPGKPIILSRVFTLLQGSLFENIALQEAAFVIASSDDSELASAISQPFPVRKGKQICAVIENVVDGHNMIPSKLFLSATWDTGFSQDLKLNLLLPSTTIIHFSKTIVTDPISLHLSTEKPFQLAVTSGLHIPVPGNTLPLAFDMSLGITGGPDPLLSLYANLNSDWKNPFNISTDLTIKPPCSVAVDVNLSTFVETGLPSGLGFQGGFDVGKSNVRFAVTLSDDPDEELLKADVKDLSITDLAAFTNYIYDLHFPTIPDFLDFVAADLYVSTGVMLANTYYPPGLSISGTIRLFGEATFSAAVSVLNGHVSLKGAADPFTIGPLTLKGRNGGKASLDLELGASAQSAKIDACITFFALEVDLFLDITLSPSPSFTFDFLLKFTDLLLFQVNAKTIGQIQDPKNLSQLDFELDAKFEQHILDYIRDQALQQLEAAKAKTTEDLNKAKAALDATEKEYQASIDSAQQKLDADYTTWKTYSDSVHNTSGAFITKYNNDIADLQKKIDGAQKTLSDDTRAAQQKLQAANVDRASKMQAAQADVNKAKAKWNSDVQDAENQLHAAQQDLSQRFGSAEQDLANAEDKVNSLQGEVNSLQGQINDYEGAHWYEAWKKAAIPGLNMAIGGVEAAKGVADGILEGCKAIVQGTEYATAKGAIPIAEKLVEDAGKTGDVAFQAAQAALDAIDKATAAAISLAQNAVTAVQKVGEGVLSAAKSALEAYKQASDAAFDLAQKAIDGLLRCAEWVAYQAASLALSIAKGASHALDVAKAAVSAVEEVGVGILDVAEDIVKDMAGLLNVTRVELHGSYKGVHDGSEPFTAAVDMVVLGNTINLSLELDPGNTAKLVADIFKAFVQHLSDRKGSTPTLMPSPGVPTL